MPHQWNWETAHLTPGAGIVLLRKFDNNWKVLGLWKDNGYDITKGHVEEGDGYLETAIRETFEEADIDELSFDFGFIYHTEDYLRIYVATTTQDAKIKLNHNGVAEHDRHSWLTLEEMETQVYNYLKPAIMWVRKEVLKNEKTDL
tara:strand:+ start:767 stop:1201 length:435 start_codon:yes stop_codon:yes gene_type:complete